MDIKTNIIHRTEKATEAGFEKVKRIVLESIERYDVISWMIVILFFLGSAYFFKGDITNACLGASGIIVLMFLISVSIEIIIEALQDVKRLGTIVGFITNGPEALCLIVGLISGNILFAASTPLGSNFLNPVLFIFAGLITGKTLILFKIKRTYFLVTVGLTASLASGFYLLDQSVYLIWVSVALFISGYLFYRTPQEDDNDTNQDIEPNHRVSKLWLIPAISVLVFSGYLLDDVVGFTSKHSHAPKALVGFLILSMLTSWPEFKSCMSLIKRQKYLASILNITVSNITNLWLAIIGVLYWLI